MNSSGEGFLNTAVRTRILRANGLYLIVASIMGLLYFDFGGVFLGIGPLSRIISAPYEAIGFVEAHGLALIIGVLLWRVEPLRSWHLTASATEALLGGANLYFWGIFIAGDALAAGYVFTSLHWVFVALQLLAAVASKNPLPRAHRDLSHAR